MRMCERAYVCVHVCVCVEDRADNWLYAVHATQNKRTSRLLACNLHGDGGPRQQGEVEGHTSIKCTEATRRSA